MRSEEFKSDILQEFTIPREVIEGDGRKGDRDRKKYP